MSKKIKDWAAKFKIAKTLAISSPCWVIHRYVVLLSWRFFFSPENGNKFQGLTQKNSSWKLAILKETTFLNCKARKHLLVISFPLVIRFHFVISTKIEKTYGTDWDLKEIPLFFYGYEKLNWKNYLSYYLYHK